MSNIIQELGKSNTLRPMFPILKPGRHPVRAHVRVVEGSRSGFGILKGVVIKRRGSGLRETFTLPAFLTGGRGENFPHSCSQAGKIEVVRHGRVRRAKL